MADYQQAKQDKRNQEQAEFEQDLLNRQKARDQRTIDRQNAQNNFDKTIKSW